MIRLSKNGVKQCHTLVESDNDEDDDDDDNDVGPDENTDDVGYDDGDKDAGINTTILFVCFCFVFLVGCL